MFKYLSNAENSCVETIFKVLECDDSLPKDVYEGRASIDDFFISIFVVNAVLGEFKV